MRHRRGWGVVLLTFVWLVPSCGSGLATSGDAANGTDETSDGGAVRTIDASVADARGAAADSAIGSGSAADADDGSAPSAWPIAATVTCAPSGSACGGAADPAIYATYRKDVFYPASQYPEASIPDPTSGGRVHVVTTSRVTGDVTSVDLDGKDSDALLASGGLDWIHVWPRHAVAGAPIWITMHTSDASYDARGSVPIAIHTAAGDAASGVFPLAKAAVPITYVTTSDARDEVLVFVSNRDAAPHTLDALLVNGKDVTAAACIPKRTLAAGESALFTVKTCAPLPLGDAWTIVAKYKDAPAAAAAGRVLGTFFPVEYWPSSSDCAFPSGNAAAFQELKSHGFDTVFMGYDWSKCPAVDPAAFVENALVPNGYYALVNESLIAQKGAATWGDGAHVPGVLLADEADSSLGTPADPSSGPKGIAARAEAVWRAQPALATYSGGSRSRHDGAFAGVTDVQGMDFYVAACAPHVTDFGNAPPLRGAYDYAVLTRENHAPLPTWIYAQGFHDGWNAKVPVLGTVINRQPTPAEMRIQAMSVVASGGKGLMWFQAQLSETNATARTKETWADIGRVNREIGAVRDLLHASDPLGGVTMSGADAIAVALRAPDAIVVSIIDLKSSSGPNDVGCAAGQDMHWSIADNTVDVTLTVPDDLALADAFEVTSGGVTTTPVSVAGRALTLSGVALSEARPTRLFVLARSASTRARVASAL